MRVGESSLAITRAVIPAAGKGTRLYPATKSQAKEMLPLGTKPVIQHVVEELAGAGIREILIVTGQKKHALEDHFDGGAKWLEEAPKEERHSKVWTSDVRLFYTRQSEALGLGDAVSLAKSFCQDKPFVVALGDALIMKQGPGPTVVERLMESFSEEETGACVASYKVSATDTWRYGILSPARVPIVGDSPFLLKDIVEKPGPDRAPSNWAVAARYVLSAEVFDALEESRGLLEPGEELQLTNALRGLIAGGKPVYGVPLTSDEFRLDVGDFVSYGRAFVRVLTQHPKHGREFVDYLRHLVAFLDGRDSDPDAWKMEG